MAFLFCNQAFADDYDANFDQSMGIDLMNEYGMKYAAHDSNTKLNFVRDLYNQNKPSKIKDSLVPTIPKIIHQIWIGPHPIPKIYQYFQKTWKDKHPDWEYKLWTDKEIESWDFSTKDLYYKARGYGERSDILRWEILKKFGGLYVDMDTECFKSFNIFHYKYDAYFTLEPPAMNKKQVTVASNVIGISPNHPIINKTIDNLRTNWSQVEEHHDQYDSIKGSSFNKSVSHLGVKRTMYPLTNAFFELVTLKNKNIIALPGGYCQPYYFNNNYPIINFLSRVIRGKGKVDNKILMRKETMAIHFYDKNLSLMQSIDFFTSMFNHNNLRALIYKIACGKDMYRYSFEKLYNDNYPSKISYNLENKIPNIIHMINLDKTQDQSNSWKNNHHDWLIKIWNKSDIEVEFKNDNLLTQEEISNYKLYIAYKILYKYGGVYVDNNMESIKSLNELNNKYNFYAGLKPLQNISDQLVIGDGIIASAPKHIIIYNILASLVDDKILDNTYDIYRFNQLDGQNIIFPASFFYPDKIYDESFSIINHARY